MWNNIYDDRELMQAMTASRKKILFLDGPSGSGKTALLKNADVPDMEIVPFRIVTENLAEALCAGKELERFYEDMDRFFPSGTLALEDADICLRGRSTTQKEIARLLELLSGKRKIILTGIKIDERCESLLDSLGEDSYDYYRFS